MEKVRRKKMQVREKVGKSRFTVFFQWFGAPEGRKVTSLKRRVRSQLARWEMKECTLLWREAHFQVKSVKKPQSQTTFGSWDVEKVDTVVARSTFPSQECQKNHSLRPLLEAEMSKKWTPLWREAHFQVKRVKKPTVSDHFWKLRCRTSARCCGAKHFSKSKCTKHTMFAPLFGVQMSTTTTTTTIATATASQQLQLQLLLLQLHHSYNYNYNHATTTPHYTTLNNTTLTTTTTTTTTTLLYTTQDYTTLHYPTVHYTRPITPLLYHCNYTTLITLHHNYNCTTLQLRLQLQYTTLHPAVVGEVTTATIATTPTITTPTTFRSISGFALPSVIHNNQPLL